MSAAITDLLTQVGQPGTVTSLSSPGKAIGAASINVGSTANWPTGTAVFFAMRQVDPTQVSLTNPSGLVAGTYTEWKGVVASGTIVNNLTLQFGTDQVYPAGSNTQVFIVISAARENAIVTWGTAQHNQDGSHSNVTANTLVTPSGGITDGNATLLQMRSDTIGNFVYSGGVVAQTSGLTGSISNIVYYIAGVRYTKSSIPNNTFTASQDTYVDIDTSGVLHFVAVTNGATSGMTLTANSVRIAKVVTNGSAITSVIQLGWDPLYNPIYSSGPVGPAQMSPSGFLYNSYGGSGLSAPGEFNYTNTTTFDVTNVPTGHLFIVTVYGFSGSSTASNIGVLIGYNSLNYSQNSFAQYHISCSITVLLQKVAGQNTVTISRGGSAASQVVNAQIAQLN